MDGLSAAASVIAVIQVSEQVFSLCSNYIKEVKNAQHDIKRLQGEVAEIQHVFEGAEKLLSGPKAGRLETSQVLRSAIDNCLLQLDDLVLRLGQKRGSRRRDKLIHQFGLRSLKWPFESKDIDRIIQKLHSYRDTFLTALNIDQTTLLLDHFERVEFDEHYNILKWISPVPYGKHHKTITEARTNNTCEWLLRHEDFYEWEDAGSSVVLWLQGSPGAGKTFVTSKVIDHVQSQFEDSRDQGFAFFYCNRNEEERRDPLSVLRSYVRQLSAAAGNAQNMRRNLRDLYREMSLNGQQLSFETCKEQLLEAVNLYSKTTIILDALDECEPKSRWRLVETLELLLTNSERPVKIFISSRPDQDIRKRFRNRPNIEIQAKHNETDIQKFISDEIVKHGSWGEMSLSLQADIIDTLLKRSDGMFQWVNLQIKQILDLESEAAIRARLGKLPKSLEATYDEIYDRIQNRDVNDKLLADRALMWVMCVYQPLNSNQLLHAICLDAENILPPAGRISESQLLHICNHLLVLDSQRMVWRLSHLSVLEYFETNHWNILQAHCHVAKVCLGRLIEIYDALEEVDLSRSATLIGRVENRLKDRDPSGSSALLRYVYYYWVNHVQTQEEQEVDNKLAYFLKAFLGSWKDVSVPYKRWCRDYPTKFGSIPKSSSLYGFSHEHISPEDSGILVACRFSFYALLLDWWEDADFPLSQVNCYGDNLLVIGAAGGSKPICKALMNRGLQVDWQGGTYGSALVAAANRGGNPDLVRFLIERGADVNLRTERGYYGSALAAAAASLRENTLETTQILIEKGAEVNLLLHTGFYGSALAAAAARWERLEVLRFLVDKGADVNLLCWTGKGSALAAAASGASLGRNLDNLRFLVEKGAKVNLLLEAGESGIALAEAAAGTDTGKGNIDAVKYLVEQGADVNLLPHSGTYGSALAAAASQGGHLNAVRYLVEQGADVNAVLKAGLYGTALAAAANGGKMEIIRFLVEKCGAEVNLLSQTGTYGSALAAAANGNRIEIVGYLIDKGADVNMLHQAGTFGSALAAAASGWRDDINVTRLLVDKGADVNLLLKTGFYGNALVAAAIQGHRAILKHLVDRGADVNIQLQTGVYGNALAAASYWGQFACVEFLIDLGAEVNLRLEYGPFLTALDAAQREVSDEIHRKTPYQNYPYRNAEDVYDGKLRVVDLLQSLSVEDISEDTTSEDTTSEGYTSEEEMTDGEDTSEEDTSKEDSE